MNLCRTFFFVAISALAGCSKPEPTIVLDDWWNEDYAKEGCRQLPGKIATCEQDQIRDLRVFEIEMTTKFASRPECSGIRIVRFKDPNGENKAAADAMKDVHWTLSLNYASGVSKQQWQLLDSAEGSELMQGDGEPAEIAKGICAIVKSRGATVASDRPNISGGLPTAAAEVRR